jgi:hypothetical protein
MCTEGASNQTAAAAQPAITLDLPVHLLHFVARVQEPVHLPPHPGAALRGALFEALRRQFCLEIGAGQAGWGRAGECSRALTDACAVCFLMQPYAPEAERGADVPRPYVLRPPLEGKTHYTADERFSFGLVTFGRALQHLPFVLVGALEMGRRGMGYGRAGRFVLQEVWAEHPLLGRRQAVFDARDGLVRPPALPLTYQQLAEKYAPAEGPGSTNACRDRRLTLRIELLTPLRLTDRGRLVHAEEISLGVLVHRLLERLTVLAARYGGGPPALPYADLLARAASAQVLDNRTTWRDLVRFSGRQQRAMPWGGLVGSFTVQGPAERLAPLVPLLAFGSYTGVGKYAVTGNGWYRVVVLY